MKLLLCVKQDLHGCIFLNHLLPKLAGHDVRVLLSDKTRPAEHHIPALAELAYLERGLPLSLKNVQITLNRHELDAMKSIAAGLGVEFRYDGLLWPRLDGNPEPQRYQLSLQEMAALDTADTERAEEWRKVVSVNAGKVMRNKYAYSCGAGFHSYHVDHSGKMSICAMSRRYAFDIFEMGFQKAWQNIENVRKIERKIDTPCLSCPVGELCIQCPGWSQVVHGDDETIVDFVCDLGHSRAEQFKAPVNEDLEEEII